MVDHTQEQKQQYVSDAKAILKSGSKTPEDLLTLAENLINYNEFGWARSVLAQAVKQGH